VGESYSIGLRALARMSVDVYPGHAQTATGRCCQAGVPVPLSGPPPAGDADPSSSSLGSAGRQDQGRLFPATPSPHHLQPPNPNNKLAKKWSGRSLRHRSTTNDLRSPATGDEQATKGSITGLRTRSSTPDLRPSVPSDRLAKKRSVKNLREALASSWSSAARLFRRPSGQPAAHYPRLRRRFPHPQAHSPQS